MKRFISFVLGLCLAFSVGAGLTGCKKEKEREFKNVIVVIGDGMGENHLLNTLTYFELEKPAFMEDQAGYIRTDSLDGTTDSAAAGTALATGKKVYNGRVALHEGEMLEQITTIAQKAQMKTGIVTTDTLDGATPASFSAHAASRSATTAIISSQATSKVDLLLGRWSSDYTTRSSVFEDQNYTVVDTPEMLQEKASSKKLVGLMKDIDSEYMYKSKTHFQLKEMTKFAVDYLENDKGFFLMIEGAYIDKHSHNNNVVAALSEVRSLMDTIAFLYEYAEDGETAIFITADHETGDLRKAESKDDISDLLYYSQGHTPKDVPIFVKNYVWKPENFGYRDRDPENTMVFEACKAIISGK